MKTTTKVAAMAAVLGAFALPQSADAWWGWGDGFGGFGFGVSAGAHTWGNYWDPYWGYPYYGHWYGPAHYGYYPPYTLNRYPYWVTPTPDDQTASATDSDN